MKNKFNELELRIYKAVIKELELHIGDTISINGWFTYEVREDGFYQNTKGYRNGYDSEAITMIGRRGYKITNRG